MYIGIDFGTSYSTLAIYVDDGSSRAGLLPDLCGGRGIPTLMRYDKDSKTWFYGDSCQIKDFPEDTVKNIKSHIRNGQSIDETEETGGRRIPRKELLKNYLSWLIKTCFEAVKREGKIDDDEQIDGVTVTVPCGFAGRGLTKSKYGQVIQDGVIAAYRDVIQDGVKLARVGEPPVYILEEPVAAAIEYLKSPRGKRALGQNPNMNILVADLGGGTFDVTVINCCGYEKFNVIAKDGDLSLGGNDFDNELLNYIYEKIKGEHPEFKLSKVDRNLDLLRATETKELLSEVDCNTYISRGNRAVVTRREFERVTSDLLSRIKTKIENCLKESESKANITIDDIDKIVLVGGGCRMPQIKNGILDLYPQFSEENIVIHRPSYSIANGAAYFASMNGGAEVMFLNDMATCTYGFRYSDSDTGEKCIHNMIFSGTEYINGKIESGYMSTFVPIAPNQEEVWFTVYESMYKKSDGDIKFAGNEEKFNKNGLEVMVPVPEKYWKNNKSKEYSLLPKMTLTSDGILKLEIYHDGVMIKDNRTNILK